MKIIRYCLLFLTLFFPSISMPVGAENQTAIPRITASNLSRFAWGFKSSAIDESGYGYFGTVTYQGTYGEPGRLVKVRLKDWQWIDTLFLTDQDGSASQIKISEGYLYCAAAIGNGAVKLIKVRLNDFKRVDEINLDVKSWDATLMTVDEASHSLFVVLPAGGRVPPYKLLKVDLANFKISAKVEIPGYISQIIADPNSQSLYLLYSQAQNLISVKLRSADLGEVERKNLGEAFITAIDMKNGELAGLSQNWRTTNQKSPVFLKIFSYPDCKLLTNQTLETDLNPFENFYDGSNRYFYFQDRNPANGWARVRLNDEFKVEKVTLPGGFLQFGKNGSEAYFSGSVRTIFPTDPSIVRSKAWDFQTAERLDFQQQPAALSSVVIDADGRFALFGTSSSPGRIMKVDLIRRALSGVLVVKDASQGIGGATIDNNSHTAYFSLRGSSSAIIAVNIDTMKISHPLSNIPPGGGLISSQSILFKNKMLYIGTESEPAQVIKINPLDSNQNQILTLESLDRSIGVSTIGNSNFGYFTTRTIPKLIKVDLAGMKKISDIRLKPEQRLPSVILATGDDSLIVGTSGMPGHIIRFKAGTLVQEQELILEREYGGVSAGVLDSSGVVAYLATNTDPGRLLKIRTTDLKIIDEWFLPKTYGEDDGAGAVSSVVLDEKNGFVYMGTTASALLRCKI